ncbi:hypothetical protein L9G16_18245, partial [Shewanella sp. A25]|nr:hypothetical protein [Shewanella shenzhenensis]
MTDTLKRLRGGPILKDAITHMKQKRDGVLKPNRNLWVYSGHDTTVAAVLDAMRVLKPHIPPFAAVIMIELRKNRIRNCRRKSTGWKTNSASTKIATRALPTRWTLPSPNWPDTKGRSQQTTSLLFAGSLVLIFCLLPRSLQAYLL